MRQLRRQSRVEEVPVPQPNSLSQTHDRDQASPEKLEKNWSQTEVKLETIEKTNVPKLESNWSRSKDKVETNLISNIQSRDKLESKVKTKKPESEDKVESKWRQKEAFSTLSDAEKIVIYFIYEDCLSNGVLETREIKIGFISTCLKIPISTIKKTIQRLEDLNHIKRLKFKNGRGGWTIYGLSKDMYDQIRNYQGRSKLETNWRQSEVKVESKVETEVETTPPSSSSYIYNTTTNYQAAASKGTDIILPELLLSFGFNQGHVAQLLRDSALVPEEIQKSLEAFAFDLSHEDVKKKVRSPIGLIMKLLKNGQPYISEKGYESEEDRLYRELIERAEKSRTEKKNLSLRMIDVKFDEWIENVPDEEKKNLVEPIGEFMGLLHLQDLKEYFKKEVFNANNIG